MGLVIFGVMALYLLISIGIVRWAISYARRNGKSAKRLGWSAALVMYLIPFWDWLPTVATHQYYCAKDSGFWVYKTLDQWKVENPGVLETLTTQPVWPHKYIGNEKNYMVTESVNKRIDLITRKDGELFFHRWRWQRELVDTKTHELLARHVDFSTGNGHVGGELELRFWLHNDHCSNGRDQAVNFGNFIEQFKGAEK